MENMILVTEDDLSEAIGKKIIQQLLPQFTITQSLGKQGFGYIKSRMKNWNEIAQHKHVLIIADLDLQECAPRMKVEWTQNLKLNHNLIFRIAVRESESWVLADHDSLIKIIPRAKPINNPDLLVDPKQSLLNLINRYGSRKTKNELIRVDNGNCYQGIAYNHTLSELIEEHWDCFRAAQHSESLQRTINSLRQLQ
jgi:hypothetical protein